MTETFRLMRDDPLRDDEIHPHGYPWRTDIWEVVPNGLILFATAWGKTETESQSKANSIVAALGERAR